MAKNLRSRLGDTHRYMGTLGITSEDVIIVCVAASTASVLLNRGGMIKLIRKLRVRRFSDAVQIVHNGNLIKVNVLAKGIDWEYSARPTDPNFVSDLFDSKPSGPRRSTYASQKARQSQRAQSGHYESPRWTWAPDPQRPSMVQVPTDRTTARIFVRTFYKLAPEASEADLAFYARRGQVDYHPDRPSGDPILSRAFNAAASLLKGAT